MFHTCCALKVSELLFFQSVLPYSSIFRVLYLRNIEFFSEEVGGDRLQFARPSWICQLSDGTGTNTKVVERWFIFSRSVELLIFSSDLVLLLIRNSPIKLVFHICVQSFFPRRDIIFIRIFSTREAWLIIIIPVELEKQCVRNSISFYSSDTSFINTIFDITN